MNLLPGMSSAPLKPTKTLPPEFIPTKQLDLTKNRRALWFLNLAAILSFFLYGWFFTSLAGILRTDMAQIQTVSYPPFLQILITFILVLVLHELIHGLFFSLFTGAAPKLGFRGLYAFAGAPDWYLPRGQYLVVSLTPFVIISLAGLLALAFVPLSLVSLILFLITLNAAGASGDLYVSGWLIREQTPILVNDTGEIFTLYGLKRSS